MDCGIKGTLSKYGDGTRVHAAGVWSLRETWQRGLHQGVQRQEEG